MKAIAIKGKTTEEIKSAVDQSITGGLRPVLAIVFTSEDDHQAKITQYLTEKGIVVFGASTGANFTDGDFQLEGTVTMLLDIKPQYFHLILKESTNGNIRDIAEQIGRAALSQFRKPAFMIVSGGISTDGDDIIEGIEKVCGKGCTIFGGLAADKLKMQRSFVFTNTELTDSGLLALILDEDKISLKGIAVGGWKPVGIDRTITKSKGNVVYTIDNEAAVNFIKRYAGLGQKADGESIGIMLGRSFQLQLNRENKHPVMRTPMLANEGDGSILFAGSLPEGSKVRLSLLPSFEVVDDAVQQFRNFKDVQEDADALILFSCAGRQVSLGPYVSKEINGIMAIWNAPLVGFFCFGEIGRVSGEVHEFHNMTCSLAMLKEK